MLLLPPILTGRGQRRIWQFHGGVHLPDEKALSNAAPLRDAPIPSQLVIPLQQHIGAPARPCVMVGDRVLKGQMVGEPQGYVSAPVHAASSGTVLAIEPRPITHPSGLPGLCVIVETDGLDEWIELPPPLPDYRALPPAQLRERIRQCGIVGMGGASFPTMVKLNPGADQPISTLIINAVECEPYITCDDLLMRERAADVIAGVRILQHILGNPECLIGVEDNKPEAIAALRAALAQAPPPGLPAANPAATPTPAADPPATGATVAKPRAGEIAIVPIPTLYPSGGEKQLIRILTGKEVPRHGIPAQVGIVCQNVGTTVAVADAVLRGRPLIERLVTVTGRAIAAPGNFRVRVGTQAAALVAASGGYETPPVRLVAGGPMMGVRIETDQVPLTKSTNCVLALTPAEAPEPGDPLACIRCGRCAEVCPVNLLPQQMYWHARAKDFDKVQDYNLFDCIECGCCAVVCPSHIPLVQYYRFAKAESWARDKEKRAAEHARARHAAREARLERQERERKGKLRQKQEALAAAPARAGVGGAGNAGAAAVPVAQAAIAPPDAATNAPTGAASGAVDGKQAAIAAARERAAAKRAEREHA